MADAIKPGALSAEVSEILKTFSDEVMEASEEAIKETMKDAKKEIQSNLHKGSGVKYGGYKKGWKTKIETSRVSVEGVVYQATKPGLTHLLERGHLTSSGTRTKAIPHIAPANEHAQKNYEKKLKERIEK